MFPGDFARLTPDKPAVVMDNGQQLTYAELDQRSTKLARLLHDRGLTTGDTVAVFLDNHISYYEVYWAVLRSGLYLTGINRYSKADEVRHILEDSGAKALLTQDARREVAAAAAEGNTDLLVKLTLDEPADGFTHYETAVLASPATAVGEELRGDVMLYSSGTTGRPKGIRRPLTGLHVGADGVPTASGMARNLLGMDETSIYLMPAPLYHAAALQWSASIHEMGGTVVVMERFDPEALLAIVDREKVTHTQLVPTMMSRMLDLPDEVRLKYDLSSLQRLAHSAAPCPPHVKHRMIEWLGPIVDEYYAGTEGAGMTYITAEEWLTHPGSVGRAFMGVIHICDDDGNEVPAGQVGTVYFDRQRRAFAYHNDPDKTSTAYHPQHDTWATFGDMGYVDDEGYLYLTDRKSFTIISGGVNIYPAEIEACLTEHPAVADAAVFGLPDPDMGEFIQAVVALSPGHTASDALVQELREHVQANLARFKTPRQIAFRDELPRLATGKLLKAPLRDEFLKA